MRCTLKAKDEELFKQAAIVINLRREVESLTAALNLAKRRSEEYRQCILNIIKRADAPIPMKQIADMTGLTLYSVRNLVKPSIAAGMVERVTIDWIIHLEIV